MTDKVQKIREEVEKLKDELNSPDASSYTEAYIIGATHTINSVLDIIDSLQEEPMNIWHDASEKSNEQEDVVIISPSDNTGEVLTRCIDVYQGHIWAYTSELLKLEELIANKPVSEELEDAASSFARKDSKGINNPANFYYTVADKARIFKVGAEWQKNHLWKPADGDDLPEIDREVIVLTQPYPLENSEYAVSFAHRPNPDGWDGIVTGKTEHYTPKTYGKGGWNIPDIVYWLDVKLPKDIEL